MTAIEQTIKDLTAEIAVRQDALNALHKVRGVPTRSAALGAAAEPVPVKKVRNARAGKRTPRVELLEAAAALAEPFGPSDLAEVVGITVKAASCIFYRWYGKGLLLRQGIGQYTRSSKFPLRAPAKDGPTRAELEESLRVALADRDKARAAGREPMTTILQSKVDKLEKQLEALPE